MGENYSSEKELLRACKRGDQSAFFQILRENQSLIRKAAYALTGSLPKACELVIQITIQFWRERKSLEAGTQIKTYLVNLTYDVAKGRRKSS